MNFQETVDLGNNGFAQGPDAEPYSNQLGPFAPGSFSGEKVGTFDLEVPQPVSLTKKITIAHTAANQLTTLGAGGTIAWVAPTAVEPTAAASLTTAYAGFAPAGLAEVAAYVKVMEPAGAGSSLTGRMAGSRDQNPVPAPLTKRIVVVPSHALANSTPDIARPSSWAASEREGSWRGIWPSDLVFRHLGVELPARRDPSSRPAGTLSPGVAGGKQRSKILAAAAVDAQFGSRQDDTLDGSVECGLRVERAAESEVHLDSVVLDAILSDADAEWSREDLL